MNVFTPRQAATIASGVYDLRLDSVASERRLFGDNLGIEDMFDYEDSSRFKGTSGAVYRPLSGFGFISAGKGKFANDVLIATRGTVTLADWLTDANVGVQRGPGGFLVHAGFNETWKSFAPSIRDFLRGRNPARIHCVGHSLGGALAFLNADFITSNKIADVAVYTFGSPRVGDPDYSRQLTDRVGKANIYRVSNPVDPVPMIPFFPFWHAPFGVDGYKIVKTSSMPISAAGHSMGDSYLPGVREFDWSGLRAAPVRESDIKSWLDEAAAGRVTGNMGEAKLGEKIAIALNWLIRAAGQVTYAGVGLTFTAGMTLVDQVAWLLTRAAQITTELGVALMGLLRMIARFLGRKAIEGAQVTAAFLRFVLGLLSTTLRAAAQRAASLLR